MLWGGDAGRGWANKISRMKRNNTDATTRIKELIKRLRRDQNVA
jgi:hypothetical protein